MLNILSKGLVALNSRVISGGAVWGEDFVLSDANLIHPVRGFALTYLEVLCLTRANFMKAWLVMNLGSFPAAMMKNPPALDDFPAKTDLHSS